MTNLVRRLRGALGLGLTWAASWAAIGAVLAIAVGLFRPQEIDAGEGPARVAAVLGLVGFLSGLGFATLLFLGERRRTIRDLSPGRVAFWGALGGAAIPWLLGADIGEAWLTAPMGGLFAATSLAIARRRAPGGMTSLPHDELPHANDS